MRAFLSSGNILSAPGRAILSWLIGQSHALPPAISQEFDAALLAEMRRHRLTPVIFTHIKRQGIEKTLPPQWLEFLQHDYYVSLQTALRQENDALQVLRALAAAGIEVFLLKGADLRLRLYDDPAARPMADLDLLVPPEVLPQARTALFRLGYSISPDCLGPRPGFREKFRVSLHFNPPPDRNLMVDLHWQIEAVANFYRLPYESLRRHAIPWDYVGVPLKVLAPEHLLIHLCLHNYDEMDQALQIIDLCLVLKRFSIDWGLFLAEAARLRCQAPLYLMLEQLAQLIPQAVPPPVLVFLGHYRPSRLERLAINESLNPVFRLLAPLAHCGRPRDWVVYLTALLWPHQDYLRALYGMRTRVPYLRQALASFLPLVNKMKPRI
jgi:hypothetical protein